MDSRKPHPSKNALYGHNWVSKTPAVTSSYKKYTSWLELETCCANIKPFVTTLDPLGTSYYKTLTLVFEIVVESAFQNSYLIEILQNRFIYIYIYIYNFMFLHAKCIFKKHPKTVSNALTNITAILFLTK